MKLKVTMAEEMQEIDWLQEGMTIEMRSNKEGYQGAWFIVKVIEELHHKKNRLCRQVIVEHVDFMESDEPDSKKHQETVKEDHLRPLPPKLLNKQWRERDAVETWHKGAWWIGYIKHFNAKNNTYLVYYGKGYEDLKISASDIRSRQNYVRTSCDWSISATMQEPADWMANEETQVVKMQSKAKGLTRYKRQESSYAQDEDWDKDEKKWKKKTQDW